MGRNSNSRSDESEITIIHELMKSGYSVAVPFGDNDPYDLIVDNDGVLYRVQCKTTWRTKNRTIRFNTHSQTTCHGEYHESSYHGEIDAFLIRELGSETIYWVDIDDATDKKMDLRYESEIDQPSKNWPKEFEFDGEI